MHEPPHEHVTTDEPVARGVGLGFGAVLGIILAILLVLVLAWYLFGVGLAGPRTTQQPAVQPTSPAINVNPTAPPINVPTTPGAPGQKP
jgi:hypothetical protein